MRKLTLAVAVALAATALVPMGTSAAQVPGCAPADHAGGEWRTFGKDRVNSRWQDAETEITPETAPLLMPKWSFSTAANEGVGGFQSTPVIADGCLYAGTPGGTVFAVNADTGETVWTKQLTSDSQFLGVTTFYGIYSLGVANGTVYANVAEIDSPYMAALDQETGEVLWTTVVSTEPGSYTNSSVAFIDDMVFIGISGPEDVEADERHPGGFALIDADTGDIIKRSYIVPEDESDRGLKGASIWATPVWDPEGGYIYAGTGQPANKDRESSRSNAIVKIDVDRDRATFGEVVDWYHGDWDNREDVDFGGSPILVNDDEGNQIVGAIQKSGKYHAVFTEDMEQAWWNQLSDRLILGNTGTAATDGESIFLAANNQSDSRLGVSDLAFGGTTDPNPGYFYSLDVDSGAINWRTPIANGVDYHLTAGGGGMVYTVTTSGLLVGFDAANGTPLVVRSLGVDGVDPCLNLSSGAIVARNTVYAVCDLGASTGGTIVAYGL